MSTTGNPTALPNFAQLFTADPTYKNYTGLKGGGEVSEARRMLQNLQRFADGGMAIGAGGPKGFDSPGAIDDFNAQMAYARVIGADPRPVSYVTDARGVPQPQFDPTLTRMYEEAKRNLYKEGMSQGEFEKALRQSAQASAPELEKAQQAATLMQAQKAGLQSSVSDLSALIGQQQNKLQAANDLFAAFNKVRQTGDTTAYDALNPTAKSLLKEYSATTDTLSRGLLDRMLEDASRQGAIYETQLAGSKKDLADYGKVQGPGVQGPGGLGVQGPGAQGTGVQGTGVQGTGVQGTGVQDVVKTTTSPITVLGPTEQLPALTGTFVKEKAPSADQPPLTDLPAGASGLDPTTALMGSIPTASRVTVPGIDQNFRSSIGVSGRVPRKDRFGNIVGYDYNQASQLSPATGSLFNWTPAGITSRPRSLLRMEEMPGAVTDPLTGQMRLGPSTSQQYAADRAYADQFIQQKLREGGVENAPFSAVQAFRNRVLGGEFADQSTGSRVNLEQLQKAFDPFLASVKEGMKSPQAQSYFERYPDVAKAYAALSPAEKQRFTTPESYAAYHYQTYGQSEGRTPPMNTFTSPYRKFFSKGGEASTEDFIKKQSGGDVSRGTLPPVYLADGSPNPDEVPSVDTQGQLVDERDEIRSESQRMLNRLKAQGPRSTGFGNLPPGVAALKRDIEQRQIDAAKPGSAATLPLIDRPGMRIASDIVRGATGTTPVEPTNPSEANRLMQGLTGAYLPTAPVVRMGQSAKAAVQQPRATAASAKRGVEELGDTAAARLARISRPNELGSQAGVIKPKGGNWFKNLDSVEYQLNALLKNAGARNLPADQVLAEMNATYTPEAMARLSPESLAQVERAYAELKPAAAINQWVKSKLTKYVKNEMGTPEDPVRALAERGVLHIPTPEFDDSVWLHLKRAEAGMPMAPQGQSEAARFWEQMSDKVIDFTTPSRIKKQAIQGAWEHQRNENIELLRENPWIENAPAKTKIYRPSISEDLVDSAGFGHIIDELENAMSPQSNLPDALRVRPKDLEKMTVPQAVERVAKINDWRINNKKALAIEETNKADLYKAYPEQKYRWIQLNKPGQFAAESDAMGHSVRGYEPPEKGGSPYYGLGGWEAIQSGRAKVYSLRDAKGQSHATIEVKKETVDEFLDKVPTATYNRWIKEFKASPEYAASPEALPGASPEWVQFLKDKEYVPSEMPLTITQIKGEGNKAIKKEFLPFVQDFVRSGNWSEVKDLLNANLLVIDRGSDLAAAMKAENATIPQYITQEELTELLRKYKAYGYKHGGPVDKTTAFIKAHA